MHNVDKLIHTNNTYKYKEYINEYKYSGPKTVKIKSRRTH